jgi:6-phosphogluconolactonase
MSKLIRGLLTIALSVGASAYPTYAAWPNQGGSSSVFVMTNNAVKNEILAYQRSENGQFVMTDRVDTGGRGSGGTNDPLQSQGSLMLSGDHNLLFAANSASGTISSFHIFNGVPVLVDRKPSGGAFPVSIAEHNHTVYVLNASGPGAVVAFKVDPFGHLYEIPNSTTYLTAANSGGSDISVSPNGQWLVVIEKVPNNIDVFPIHPDGTLGAVVTNKSVTPGVFAINFTPNGQLIVSENQPSDGGDTSSISSYNINANGTLTAISQSIPTQGNGNCWNVITPNGQTVYVDNAGTFSIAGFSIAANGTLAPIDGTVLSTLPDGAVNIDITTSGDGKYLYEVNSGLGTIGVYSINSNGTLTQQDSIEGLPQSAGFNGIAAL